ncbi:hypothetical protein [Blastococcus sp. TF02A-26]|uniref:hypothetical protein n=1 Tax=Blastococcus sp. TF02A-26 TaxID=2250577 RepID=UPI001313E462|nr:hypothetical protein [Blastococcus sp. TF02A-26]
MTATATVRGRPPIPATGAGGLDDAPVAGTTPPAARHAAGSTSRASSWPRRATCGQGISTTGPGLAFSTCVLSPGHLGTCLPAPGVPA